MKKQAEDEAQQLLSRLKVIEEEEAERLRKKRLAEYEFQVQTEKIKKLMDQELSSKLRNKFSMAKIQMVSEPTKLTNNVIQVKSKAPLIEDYLFRTDLDQYNFDLAPAFGDLALLGITETELDQQCDDLFCDTPIKFIARKGNKIDEKVKFYIHELGITIPIAHIKGDLYLIGSDRLNIKQNTQNDNLMVRVGGGYVKFDEHMDKYHRYYQRMLVIHMIKSGESLEFVCEQIKANKKIINLNQIAEQEAQREQKFKRSVSRGSMSPIPKSPTTGGTRMRIESSGNGFGSSTPTGRGSMSLRSKANQSYNKQNRSTNSPSAQHVIKFQE